MDPSHLLEMRIADVRRGPADGEPASYLVLLEEIKGARQLPIWIGPHEGMILAWLLARLELPRPLAHQFMFKTLQDVRARVVEVRIDRLAERTFFAVAVIEGPGGAVEVDARPSDALSAALLADARVTARADLFDAPEEHVAAMMDNLAEKFPESARDIVESQTIVRAQRDAERSSPAAAPPA